MPAGSQPGSTETYMISGVGSVPNMTIFPPPAGFELRGNEIPSEYVFDQGQNYLSTGNYGYIYTGYESAGEWGDPHSTYGLDSQDLHYMGMQAESMPYMYYNPGYGYSQIPYNQYTSYVPGPVAGLDGQFVGVQPYLNIPSYQISSPSYVPVVVQPSSDFVPTTSIESAFVGSGTQVITRSANAGSKITPIHASVNAASSAQLTTSAPMLVLSDASQPSQNNQAAHRPSEGLQVNIRSSNLSMSQQTTMQNISVHPHQGANSNEMQAAFQFSNGRTPYAQSYADFAGTSSNGLSDPGSNVPGWARLDKQRQGPQFTVALRNSDIFGEQNKGPRKNRAKDQSTLNSLDSAELVQRSDNVVQEGRIIIRPDNYNKDDFPIEYPDAKFFVIKSYSEDDVHKSIKYNVWSSTHNGNRKLDSAYADAQRRSIGKPSNCPVFLFFSVNASGQFCGLAEMVGPVDFEKDMNFWQQDKWSGSFPVKWHMIKDVSNASLRHIALENNENKPVTNSRDTQEIPYGAGINMLKIYKSNLMRTSILDDFMFYEERQKKMLEDKLRNLGRTFDASHYMPAFVIFNRQDGNAEVSLRADGNQSSDRGQVTIAVGHQPASSSEQPLKHTETAQDDSVSRPLKVAGKDEGVSANQFQNTDDKLIAPAVSLPNKANEEHATIDVKDQIPVENGEQPNVASHNQNAEAKMKPTANHLPKSDEKQPTVANQLKAETKPPSSDVHGKVDGTHSKWRISRPLSSNENTNRLKDVNSVGKSVSGEEQLKKNTHVSESSSVKVAQPKLDSNGKDKDGVPSVGPKQVASRDLGNVELEVIPTDFVTVGSMQIHVKDLGQSFSSVTLGGSMRNDESKGMKLGKKGTSADSLQLKRR
ncbi:YTH domain-containing protein ECT4-like isoform X1 [Zingiber officinale]|uniref:YTH domain-containing protein ECT4-like isoform X1 n=1 Tax=Zingiber officinale TaxID=94328 RepID=UPI001C4C503A|nr:YTH domain-containing protein ECT4-like isoform X1 [Zingiber officinale]